MTARRYIVRGRVQGVGFRWFTVKAARRAGLAGWVRNLPDGSVEVVAQGPAEALANLRRDLESGPVASSVRQVDESDAGGGEALPGAGGFDVRY